MDDFACPILLHFVVYYCVHCSRAGVQSDPHVYNMLQCTDHACQLDVVGHVVSGISLTKVGQKLFWI